MAKGYLAVKWASERKSQQARQGVSPSYICLLVYSCRHTPPKMLPSDFLYHTVFLLFLFAPLGALRGTGNFEVGSPSHSSHHRQSLAQLFDDESPSSPSSSRSSPEWSMARHAEVQEIEKGGPIADVSSRFHEMLFVPSHQYKQTVTALEIAGKEEQLASSTDVSSKSPQIDGHLPSQLHSLPATSSSQVGPHSTLASVSRKWSAESMRRTVKSFVNKVRKPSCLKSKP